MRLAVKPEQVGFSEEKIEKLTSFMRDSVQKGLLPFAQMLVARQGKIAYCKSVGVQDDAIFRIFSMTKPVVSLALMMLVEESRIHLDHDLGSYIKAFRQEHLSVLVWKDAKVGKHGKDFQTIPCANKITIADLLRHTAGFSYGFDKTGKLNVLDAIYNSNPKLFGKGRSGLLGRSVSLEDFVNELATMPLAFEPGTCFLYGHNSQVVGRLVEVVSGQPLDVFLDERIFKPLQMHDTSFVVPKPKLHRFCSCWIEHPKQGLVDITSAATPKYDKDHALSTWLSGGEGLVSTISDYFRFCQCILNGGTLDGAQIIGRKTLEVMAENALPGNRVIGEMRHDLNGYMEIGHPNYAFGLGFSIALDAERSGGPYSKGTLTWGGAAATSFIIDPAEEMIAITMTQVMEQNAIKFPFRELIFRIVYGALIDRKFGVPRARL